MESASINHLDRNQWIELNRKLCDAAADEGDILFTIADYNSPPPLNVEICLSKPLKEVKSLKVKVEFEIPPNSKGSSSSFASEWKEAVKKSPRSNDLNGKDYAQYEVIDSTVCDDGITKIHLRITSYLGKGRTKTLKYAWFYFKINDEDSQIYLSPQTEIQCRRTTQRKKKTMRPFEILNKLDPLFQVPRKPKDEDLFQVLFHKYPDLWILVGKEDDSKELFNHLTKDEQKMLLSTAYQMALGEDKIPILGLMNQLLTVDDVRGILEEIEKLEAFIHRPSL